MLGMYSAVELHTILAMAVVLYSDAVPIMCMKDKSIKMIYLFYQVLLLEQCVISILQIL